MLLLHSKIGPFWERFTALTMGPRTFLLMRLSCLRTRMARLLSHILRSRSGPSPQMSRSMFMMRKRTKTGSALMDIFLKSTPALPTLSDVKAAQQQVLSFQSKK